MKTPYLAIGMNDKAELTFAHVIDDGETRPYEFESSLRDLDAEGLERAMSRVGRIVLDRVSYWYPKEWARFPSLKFPSKTDADLDLIIALMAKSIGDNTTAHIPSINILIGQLLKVCPAAAERDILKKWPSMQKTLEEG